MLQAQDAPPDPPDEETEQNDQGTARSDEVVVTASRHDEAGLDTPYSVSILDGDEARRGPDGRSLPNTLTREPSVLLQKTGPGQSSPFIRGFTGFRTLWLVDGIRLNNSVWRDGPNQYGGTVDLFSIDRLELVRGPGSVLWGSDAIGGTINALTAPADASDGWHGSYETRYSTGERSFFNRLEFAGGEEGKYALKGGVTDKNFGTINAGQGSGDLHGTSYDEQDYDLRLDVPLNDRIELTFGAQSVRQFDVPRTHKTVDSVTFHGTKPGTELFRKLDQSRDMAYTRLSWDGALDSFYDEAELTLSWQRQQEEQKRLRSGGKFDVRGFDVLTTGVQMEMLSDTELGLFTYGFDYYHDDVDSYRRDFVGGAFTGEQIQGPVADDAEYDLFGAYVQDEIVHGDYETTLGVRWTHASAKADKVDNPNIKGSSPSTPGNVLKLNEGWSDVVSSVRTLKRLSDETSVYAGLSQGFRAPNLSDLTADLDDSGSEQPTPGLEPEHYLSIEVGAKTQREDWNGDAALFYTWIDDMIVKSPTGELLDGSPVVQKDNVGDGFVWGVELRGEKELSDEWSAFAVASYIDGKVDQFKLPSGEKVKEPLDRLMPLTAVTGITYEPEGEDWWFQADVLMADKADKLSLRDETDLERIPPGGTPGYAVFGIRSGMQLDDSATVGLALENIFDKDYRIHGSGQNEPGRSLVFSYRVRF